MVESIPLVDRQARGKATVTQGGFEAAAEGLQAVRSRTQWINQQVSAGKLASGSLTRLNTQQLEHCR
ncbi:hypothetical protein [Saccharopolyspora phatthalungensis]|uniref:Uncharacterized protein n=1 Tax=Saccharopolyspora phatthalungensis TaxID=664693 RepID=A0A840PYN6_9PSEU|nr:hypothetical protein [Saccharopolyspora phatthalungensis]MBB5152877.1 hypothetical protein [Saccharopolyspora phatthalungensis]